MIIPDFTCPSDNINTGFGTYSVAQSFPICGMTNAYGTPMDDILFIVYGNTEFRKTNYLAVAGAEACTGANTPGAKWGGMMTARLPFTLEQASNLDGTAHTAMYCEVLGDIGNIWGYVSGGIQPGRRVAGHSWLWAGLTRLWSYNFPHGTMVHPTIKNPANAGQYLKLLGDGKLCDAESTGAAHPAGVNFAFGDGTVHTIPRTINWELYYGNGGLRDGITERGF
jgi:hypothetical protein